MGIRRDVFGNEKFTGGNGYSSELNMSANAEEAILNFNEYPVNMCVKRLKEQTGIPFNTDFIERTFTPSSWHHMGKNYKQVEFYSADEIIDSILNDNLIDKYLNYRKNEGKSTKLKINDDILSTLKENNTNHNLLYSTDNFTTYRKCMRVGRTLYFDNNEKTKLEIEHDIIKGADVIKDVELNNIIEKKKEWEAKKKELDSQFNLLKDFINTSQIDIERYKKDTWYETENPIEEKLKTYFENNVDKIIYNQVNDKLRYYGESAEENFVLNNLEGRNLIQFFSGKIPYPLNEYKTYNELWEICENRISQYEEVGVKFNKGRLDTKTEIFISEGLSPNEFLLKNLSEICIKNILVNDFGLSVTEEKSNLNFNLDYSLLDNGNFYYIDSSELMEKVLIANDEKIIHKKSNGVIEVIEMNAGKTFEFNEQVYPATIEGLKSLEIINLNNDAYEIYGDIDKLISKKIPEVKLEKTNKLKM